MAEEVSSKTLTSADREKLKGWVDIERPEVEQILPLISPSMEEKTVAPSKRLDNTKSLAKKVLDKITELEQEIDKRCSQFKVSSLEERGSPLFQAMVRVFNERTTTVTYNHYKRALEYRQQLAEEDTAKAKML